MSLGRNDPCPCGSGKKLKKCHVEFAGMSPARYAAQGKASQWGSDVLAFLKTCDGYVPPMSEEERENWKHTGCPFQSCFSETDGGTACASPNCGV